MIRAFSQAVTITRMDRSSALMCAVFVFSILVAAAQPGAAAVYTAGTGGTHITIQAAVNAAVASGGDNEIRVLQGTYSENLVIPATLAAGSLTITGGWRPGFTARSQDPALTLVDGQGLDAVLTIRSSGGELEISGLTFTNGQDNYGGGVEIDPQGAATIRLSNTIVENNLGTASSGVYGGGVYIAPDIGSEIELSGSIVRNNTAESTGSQANGAGLYATAENGSIVKITHNIFDGNVCRTLADSNSEGGGVYAFAYDTSSLEFSDNVVMGNVSAGVGSAIYTGAYLGSWGTASTVVARRNLFWDNSSTKSGYEGPMLGTHVFYASSAIFSDSIVASGGGIGVSASASGDGVLSVVNFTVTDCADRGMNISSGSSQAVHLSNTLSWDLGAVDSLSGNIITSNNHSGVNPLFVDPAAGNFQLQATSPAVDYGSNSASDMGDRDLAGGQRIIGTAVDAGAFEHGNILVNGFESGTTIHWSSSVY